MRCSTTVCLVDRLNRGPWIYWHDLDAACNDTRAAGLDGIELFTEGPDQIPVETIKETVARHELTVSAVGTGAGKVIHGLTLTAPDLAERARASAFVTEMINFGATLGAPAIIGSMQGFVGKERTRDEAIAMLRDALGPLGSHAAEQGTFLIYEPLNRYESDLLNTQAAAAELLDGITGVRTLADLFHMNIEEVDLAESIRTHADLIGHVHLADSNRRPAGDGHSPLAEAGRALQEIGYEGWVSAEAFPWPDSATAARTTAAAFQRWFT